MDAAVKVDSELLKKIEYFVKKNKFTYSSKKQVVNLAILEFLNFRNSQKILISDSYKKPLLKEGFLKTNSLKNKEKRGKNNEN